MKTTLSFDDVLLLPQFSEIGSRADVDLSSNFMGMELKLPIISSNMACVTETAMAQAMSDCGAASALHRFMPVKDNAYMYQQLPNNVKNAPTCWRPVRSACRPARGGPWALRQAIPSRWRTRRRSTR